MAKKVEHDPQQYNEDWFDVTIPMGKEFELPNLSNMSATSFSAPTLSFQNILIHTNPQFTEIDAVSNPEIECAPFPRVVVATKPAATEEHRPYSSISSANSYSANPHSLPITSHRFIALRNQQSLLRFIPTPRITSLNPPFFYHSSQTIHVKHQETQFSGILKHASPCYSDSVVTFTTARNAQTVENHLAGSNVGSNMTVSDYQQNPSTLYSRIDQPILAANLDSLDQTNLNAPKYLSLPLGLVNTSLSSKAQEIQLPNAHNLQPKQELLGGTALSSHFNSHLRRTPRSLSIAQTSRDIKHKCFICKASFINGNALGGHMSYHAKKRKIEAWRRGQFFEPGSASGFGDSSPGSQYGSDKSR
ncbi:hypothetical protein OIU79_009415 [Salix purpurea]|uniref:C2H2-type domain-containing protein n=1 Tax=Salix purpurea TaxID=77065 RepID=A0A9Q0TKX0_SALPP|nr:hypothetical protein OIU79_009415 [Salix purpurea]